MFSKTTFDFIYVQNILHLLAYTVSYRNNLYNTRYKKYNSVISDTD